MFLLPFLFFIAAIESSHAQVPFACPSSLFAATTPAPTTAAPQTGPTTASMLGTPVPPIPAPAVGPFQYAHAGPGPLSKSSTQEYVLVTPPMTLTFQQAEDYCMHNFGAYIVEFYNQTELSNAIALKNENKMATMWIGIWNAETGNLHWVYDNVVAYRDPVFQNTVIPSLKSGAVIPPWTPATPSCAYLNASNEIAFDPCDQQHSVICQVNPATPASTTLPPTTLGLGTTAAGDATTMAPAATPTPVTQKCYINMNEAATWSGAITLCDELGYANGHLPVLTLPGDWTAFAQFMQASNMSASWLGLTYLADDGIDDNWQWVADYGYANFSQVPWLNAAAAVTQPELCAIEDWQQIPWQWNSNVTSACPQPCAAFALNMYSGAYVSTGVADPAQCDAIEAVVCQFDYTQQPPETVYAYQQAAAPAVVSSCCPSTTTTGSG